MREIDESISDMSTNLCQLVKCIVVLMSPSSLLVAKDPTARSKVGFASPDFVGLTMQSAG